MSKSKRRPEARLDDQFITETGTETAPDANELVLQKLDRIIELLERIAGQDEKAVAECNHVLNDFVSRDGWIHCQTCDIRLQKEGEIR